MKMTIKIVSNIILLSGIALSASTEIKIFPIKGTDKKIVIEKGNIIDVPVQAIVNAANEDLLAGGGVCGAIFDAAGHEKLQEACNGYPVINGIRCPTGKACITNSFNLQQQSPIQYIIHTVGPDCRIIKNEQEQNRLLVAAYNNTLHLAEKHHITSLAFPFISSGIYAFIQHRAATIALETVLQYLKKNTCKIREVHFVLFSQADFDLFYRIIFFQFPELLQN